MEFEVRDLVTLATIVFAAGILYGSIKSFRREFDEHRAESSEWRKRLERTLFGEDGRNGLVGDNIKHEEHIKICRKHLNMAGSTNDRV